MLRLAVASPNRTMLRFWRGGSWQTLSCRQFALQVASLAASLRTRGVAPGDRVLIVMENRPEFLVADMAIMSIGAITVPAYVTNTVEDHRFLLQDSGARAALVSNAKLAGILNEAAQPSALELLVSIEDVPEGPALSWQSLVQGEGDLPMLVAEVEQIPAGRLACIIYTSGTGGPPKGVMLPHRAMLANRHGITELVRRLHLPADARYLSFLPLSHAYEHTVAYLLSSFGLEIVFSRGAERLAAELIELRPHVLTAVPRLFEVLRGKILAGLETASGLQKKLFWRTIELGLKRLDGHRLTLTERLQDRLLDRIVRQRIRARFGGQIAALVSGGARLDPGLSGFFLALGLPVLQGYGQTEAGPVVSVNLPWNNDRRSVGPPLPGVSIRIAEDGEVLVRGDLTMVGYWNNPEATSQTLREDPAGGAPWLHTGDVGMMKDGRLHITDRKRDFIKTLGGEMVSPARIEALLMAETEIVHAVVAGEGQPHLVALIVPASDAQDRDGIAAAVARVNKTLPTTHRVRQFALVPAFTQETGELTPTQKVKRRIVLQRHQEAVLHMYR
ncbi:AMP-dependent synthetase/ligase [Pseudoroseomonas globiformis]|uniref:AMP-dependent synthetase/ligase n=1 Tax=Teichococcus globiformis TaxID=2307229 RepID=A0ABV7G241_9PROT